MSGTVNAPFGLRPAMNAFGQVNPIALKGALTSGVTTAIAKGSPVTLDANGLLMLAAAGAKIFGVFAGCEYQTAGGVVLSNKFSTTTDTISNAVAYVWPAENTVFEVQASAALTQVALGSVYDIQSNTAAQQTAATGVSTVVLDATVTATDSAQLAVIGVPGYADNNNADTVNCTYPIFLVRIVEPLLGQTALGDAA